MVDYTGMRRSILSVYGEPMTVTVGVVNHSVTAAFMEPGVSMDLGVPVNRPDPQIVIETAAWETTTAKSGDTVTRSAVVYTVVDVQPADDGLSTVILRRYA